MSPEAIIRLRDVRMRYPIERGLFEVLRRPFVASRGTEALKGIDLDVAPGAVFGLLGPNGAGKSTLTRILCNLIVPTSGRVAINGCDHEHDPTGIRRSVGLVSSDERTFFWRLSALENLMFFAVLHEVPRPEAKRRIREYIEYFGVGAHATRRFGLLSSGQKKIFSIIRALVPAPPVLLMDEPTNALDPEMAHQVMEFVRHDLARRQGRTIVWATHRLEEVREMCDALMVLAQGERRFLGSFEQFVALGRTSAGERPLIDVFRGLVGG